MFVEISAELGEVELIGEKVVSVGLVLLVIGGEVGFRGPDHQKDPPSLVLEDFIGHLQNLGDLLECHFLLGKANIFVEGVQFLQKSLLILVLKIEQILFQRKQTGLLNQRVEGDQLRLVFLQIRHVELSVVEPDCNRTALLPVEPVSLDASLDCIDCIIRHVVGIGAARNVDEEDVGGFFGRPRRVLVIDEELDGARVEFRVVFEALHIPVVVQLFDIIRGDYVHILAEIALHFLSALEEGEEGIDVSPAFLAPRKIDFVLVGFDARQEIHLRHFNLPQRLHKNANGSIDLG